ncbi:MAG: mechanosensitive ion channel family protein [Propionibacteriaceae bacterium]|nr:mechanosensitive ion channel family protein [Propionibacteriaceae bacterium]
MNSEAFLVATETWALIGLVLLVSLIAHWLVVRLIKVTVKRALKKVKERPDPSRAERILAAATGSNTERRVQRMSTIGALLRSIATFTIVVIAVTTVLAILNVPVAPLLASAGVGGIALGFGAQSLIKDFLSGIFIVIEDQYGVGDLIDTGTVVGTVEDVGLRVTRLRDASGEVWYVRNGEILRVGNHSQGWSTAIADIPIAPDEDTHKALAVLEQVADELDADEEFASVLLERPTVVGVNAMSPNAVTLRMTAKTAPNQHWGVQRALLEQAQRDLTAADLRLAFPGAYQ